MSEHRSVVLAEESGVETRSVELEMEAEGGIEIHTYDHGPTAELIFGERDHEFHITVKADAVLELAFRLLQERFSGDLQAAEGLKRLCVEHDISYGWGYS